MLGGLNREQLRRPLSMDLPMALVLMASVSRNSGDSVPLLYTCSLMSEVGQVRITGTGVDGWMWLHNVYVVVANGVRGFVPLPPVLLLLPMGYEASSAGSYRDR